MPAVDDFPMKGGGGGRTRGQDAPGPINCTRRYLFPLSSLLRRSRRYFPLSPSRLGFFFPHRDRCFPSGHFSATDRSLMPAPSPSRVFPGVARDYFTPLTYIDLYFTPLTATYRSYRPDSISPAISPMRPRGSTRVRHRFRFHVRVDRAPSHRDFRVAATTTARPESAPVIALCIPLLRRLPGTPIGDRESVRNYAAVRRRCLSAGDREKCKVARGLDLHRLQCKRRRRRRRTAQGGRTGN